MYLKSAMALCLIITALLLVCERQGRHYEHDVFLSFRGQDTRKGFSDHLYNALIQDWIRTIRDKDEILPGERIEKAIEKAINNSRIAIIVFSQNYTSSTWCLTELVKIMECKRIAGLIVLPVFYRVDPSEVREQSRRRGEAFDKMEKVEGSRAALTEAIGLKGRVLGDRYESEFIQDIVEDVKKNNPELHSAK